MDITNIVELVLTIIVTILTGVIVPYIKKHLEAEKLDKLLTYADIAVTAAEQIYDAAGLGDAKKAYVKRFLENNGFTLDTDAVDAIIESAVYNLTHSE